jgi:hypothetical protein
MIALTEQQIALVKRAEQTNTPAEGYEEDEVAAASK